MGFSFGPRFDSAQLHDQDSTTSRQGGFVFREKAELDSAFSMKSKNGFA
jgi:hypothetical protein